MKDKIDRLTISPIYISRGSRGGCSTVFPMLSKKKHVFGSSAFWKALKVFSLIFIFPKEIFNILVQQLMHALALARKGL